MFKMYTIVQPEQSNIKDEVFMQCPGQSVYIHIYVYIYIYRKRERESYIIYTYNTYIYYIYRYIQIYMYRYIYYVFIYMYDDPLWILLGFPLYKYVTTKTYG